MSSPAALSPRGHSARSGTGRRRAVLDAAVLDLDAPEPGPPGERLERRAADGARSSNQGFAALLKRSLDVVGATTALALLLPVFLGCALAVKANSQGPVFFRQVRVGRNGEPFQCFKFRTMRQGADTQLEELRGANIQDGPAFKVPGDPRITRVGRILRKFSLDELPQFLNVLIGDMSLVGPRPPIPTEVAKYSPWQRRRISVKPGLTCVWQVYGRNRVSFDRWVAMDLYYIDNWSLWLDLKLIVHTVRAVIGGTGM
jgi:exopolysaccharide biosynthesis polyprenyl glycosylphosphotransferase